MGFDVRTRLSMLKSSAKQRGINVNLDINKYQAIINMGCEFCGDDLKNENGYCLDRVDSNKGYVITNVVPCCKICNRAKSNMNVIDFVDWLKKANDHMQKKIDIVNKLKELGCTEQMFYDMLDSGIEDLIKGKPKERLKIVNSNKLIGQR